MNIWSFFDLLVEKNKTGEHSLLASSVLKYEQTVSVSVDILTCFVEADLGEDGS